ncbi:phosphoserine phosphatase SerB [Derxia gummosa]|uniref:Phosphoserine phosphatase n=1 Tax=Derxia gummosa DSM 723 TaxID=1121388 RepID=A0A8B6X7N7_9BURK|nr:phosphoserine phosphatase SerB [Derxia gummosa]
MNLVVHGPQIDPFAIDAIRARLRHAAPVRHGLLDDGRSFLFRNAPDTAGPRQAIAELCATYRLNHVWLETVPKLSDFSLIALDMDSTLVTIETIDEIADYCGRKEQVAAITEAAMRGEITDYSESLRRRVALLDGLDTAALERVYEERMKLTPGAETLLAAAKNAGLKTMVVSGGFTFFTEKLKARLALDYARSNTLGIADGKLDGTVVGEIVDADVKARTVLEVCDQIGVPGEKAITVGDGANDLKMMGVSGLSVAFHAKPKVREQAKVAINHGGLDGLLRVLG